MFITYGWYANNWWTVPATSSKYNCTAEEKATVLPYTLAPIVSEFPTNFSSQAEPGIVSCINNWSLVGNFMSNYMTMYLFWSDYSECWYAQTGHMPCINKFRGRRPYISCTIICIHARKHVMLTCTLIPQCWVFTLVLSYVGYAYTVLLCWCRNVIQYMQERMQVYLTIIALWLWACSTTLIKYVHIMCNSCFTSLYILL